MYINSKSHSGTQISSGIFFWGGEERGGEGRGGERRGEARRVFLRFGVYFSLPYSYLVGNKLN